MATSDRHLRVLIIEDSDVDATLTIRALRRAGFELSYDRVDTSDEMARALARESFDLVISDYALPGFSLWQALQVYHAHECDAPFIVVSGVIGEDMAVAAMRIGAHDYVRKDDLRRLIPAVARELREADVRRQKRAADQAKRQSEAMLKLVMDGVPVMLAYVDAELRYKTVNREYAEWFGAMPAQLAGRSVAEVLPSAALAEAGPDLQEALAGQDVDRETFVQSPTKGGRWVRMRYAPHRDAEGEVAGVFIVGSDVMEQRAARKEIADREAEVRTILDSAADGIIAIDADGRIESFNPAAERVFGYTASEVVGQNVTMLMPEPDRSRHDSYLSEYRRSGFERVIGREREVVGRRKSGEDFPMALRIARSVRGQHVGFIGTLQDITERKELEAHRDKLLERTQHAERLEALGTFAGGIAHDLNNILAPILMYTAVLETEGLSSPAQGKTLDNIRGAARRATQLVEQIVSFAAGEQGERAPIEMRAVIREVLDPQRAAAPRGVEILYQGADQLWVHGDSTQLHQCVLNLVVNAVQALPPTGGRVTVRTRAATSDAEGRPPELLPGTYHVIEVEDTGEGIPPPIQRRIFDPFFSTKRSKKGTGLGLAIVHSIVRSHDGALTLDSEVGVGTSIRVYLPAARALLQVEECRPLEGLRVLFVDDERTICKAATSLLRASGVGAEAFECPRAALRRFAAAPQGFDVAIVDQHMPELSGVEVVEQLRAIRADLPVIVGTGRWTPTLESRCAELRTAPVLRKPYTAEQLSAAILAARGASISSSPPNAPA